MSFTDVLSHLLAAHTCPTPLLLAPPPLASWTASKWLAQAPSRRQQSPAEAHTDTISILKSAWVHIASESVAITIRMCGWLNICV